jgi:preprotein translocase subunit YajC
MDSLLNGVLISLEPAAKVAERSIFVDLFPFFAIVLIFYVLVMRPQQQKEKVHTAMLESLVKGNRVVTAAGIHARIVSLESTTLLVEIGDKTKMTIDRSAVALRLDDQNKK